MATGVLLPAPVFIALNSDGQVIPGALLQFYLTTTTTPATVYADGALTTPLANPVVANGSGQFPAIYLDPTITYRVQLQNASAGVLADIDPANLDVTAATQTQVNAGVATGVYVSPATLAAWTGVATALGYTPLNKAGDFATGLNIVAGNINAAAVGYLGSPQNPQSGAYTLAAGDAGCTIYCSGSTAQTITIPANVTVGFATGTIISILSFDSATVTIAAAAGVTLNFGGPGGTGSRSLAQWGLATLIKVSSNTWIVFGTNLS